MCLVGVGRDPGGGGGWVGVLEILGGWVAKHPPSPMGVGQFWVPGCYDAWNWVPLYWGTQFVSQSQAMIALNPSPLLSTPSPNRSDSSDFSSSSDSSCDSSSDDNQ